MRNIFTFRARIICLLLVAELTATPLHASTDEKILLTQQDFLASVFNEQQPAVKLLWLTPEDRARLEAILDHKVSLRVPYWQHGDTSVWVLNEVGKDRPITTGVAVRNGAISTIRVLTYRESRGWEVKHDFFTRQFTAAFLTSGDRLNQHIDNITGATLSVQAMQNMARSALVLDAIARATENNTPAP